MYRGLQCFNKIYDVTHYNVVNDIEIVFSQSFLMTLSRRWVEKAL